MSLRENKIIIYSGEQNTALVKEREQVNAFMKLQHPVVKIIRMFFNKKYPLSKLFSNVLFTLTRKTEIWPRKVFLKSFNI